MGFLSVYSDVKRVFVGPQELGYWVDIKEHVSQGDREAAERALATMVIVDGKPVPQPDVIRYRQLMMLASIAEWNLDDDNGQVWPRTMRSVQNLPDIVFDQIWWEVDKVNTPLSKEESQRFPDGDDGGDQDGADGASVS